MDVLGARLTNDWKPVQMLRGFMSYELRFLRGGRMSPFCLGLVSIFIS